MPLHDDDAGLHLAMAGRGNPYGVLTPARLRLLMALHQGALTALPEADRVPLAAASLVQSADGRDRPTFFIATATETARVDEHARRVGRRLAERLLARWDELAATYATLRVAREFAFSALAFLLVGDRILDVGLLDALAADGMLLPPAPARPAPAAPDARYYLWLIAGQATQLGQYGQRPTPLPWDDWDLITFGRYTGPRGANHAREAVEQRARHLALSGQVDSPQALAAHLALPLFVREDVARWSARERACTADLLLIYRHHAGDLQHLYNSLAASRTAAFGEFFCWYDHVAYAHAIDALIAAGVLTLSGMGYAAMLWQRGIGGAF